MTMKREALPETLYRKVKGSSAAGRAPIVCALQHDGTAPVRVDADSVSWSARAAALLRDLKQAGDASGTARGHALPFASLRAAIAAVVPEAVTLQRDLGAPWMEREKAERFLEVSAVTHLQDQLGRALSLWTAQALRPWAEKVDAPVLLVDTLQEMGSAAFEIVRREGSLPDVLATTDKFAEARDAIVQRFAAALEGRELFDRLGPVWRIVRGNSKSNELEFITWPSRHDDGLYSMVACISVETIPFSKQPIVNVRASRRRWLAAVPSGYPLTGQRSVTVTLMGRQGPPVALETPAPVRSLAVQDPIAPEFLGQMLRVSADTVGAPLSELVERGAAGDTFVGIAYSPKLGGTHPIGAGASTRDQTDLFDAVQEAVDAIGFIPIAFEETPSLKRAPKRSCEVHKALEMEALLSDVAISLGRNDLDDDASIEAAWSSLGMNEERPAISAKAAAKAREKLAEVRALNVARVVRVFGDRRPSVVVIARTDEERQLLKTVLASLFGTSIDISARPLPADVHGPRSALPASDGKTLKRFEARVEAWHPLAAVLNKAEGGCHALVQAEDRYEKKPDDPVNKPAGRYSLATQANANVQYLRPRGPGHRGLANYLHRVQAAMYDLVFGHSGLVTEIRTTIASAFQDEAARPTSVVGISVLSQSRTRISSRTGKLCLATRIDCETGRTTARVGWHDGEMRWSASWEPLFETLKRIASPSIKPSLGDSRAQERTSFQTFVREILDECTEVGDRPLVVIDSTNAASLWPWLADGQIGGDICLGTERLDVSRRWPGIRIVRVRLDHAARVAERKTVDYRGVDTATGTETGEVFERYCPTITARTIRLSGQNGSQAHYWSTAGYFQMSFPRGLSVYRALASLVPVEKALRDVTVPPHAKGLLFPLEIPLYDVSYRLPNPLEMTVAVICEGDEPDRIAHLVSSLRYGYGHTQAWTALPAPLSFESKARDYMTRFALDISDDEDDAATQVGAAARPSATATDTDDAADAEDAAFGMTDPRAWRQLVEKEDTMPMNSMSLAAGQFTSREVDEAEGAGGEASGAPSQTAGERHDRAPAEPSTREAWSALAPVIRLPEFVTVEWLAANITVQNRQLSAIHNERHDLARLTGFHGWPDVRPDSHAFAELLHEGLRYPRFAAAVTQMAKRSLAHGKKKHWSIYKHLVANAEGRAAALAQEAGKARGWGRSDRVMAEILADSGETELALAHLFRRAYVRPAPAEVRRLIETDDRFAPLRAFASDTDFHLHRDDYAWEGDLRTLPTRPGDKALEGPHPQAEREPTLSLQSPEAELPAVAPPSYDRSIAAPTMASSPRILTEPEATDGTAEWAAAMASIAAVASAEVYPDEVVLDCIVAQVRNARAALAAYIASRPRGIDPAELIARAQAVLTLARQVLCQAAEEDGLASAPDGPFIPAIEEMLAESLEADVQASESLAETARTHIAQAQAILDGSDKMARLREAFDLQAQAIASGREAGSRAVAILDRLLEDEPEVPEPLPQAGDGLLAVRDEAFYDLDEAIAGEAEPVPAGDWDSTQEEISPTETLEDQIYGAIEGEVAEEEDRSLAQADRAVPKAEPQPDLMAPQMLARFEALVEARRFGLAYHLCVASKAAGLFSAFPISPTELRLAAVSSHVNHAALQGSDLVHGLLRDAHAIFDTLEDEASNVTARRIIALASLAPFAFYHNDPEAKLALDALRQVADGLGDAAHKFREALAAPLRQGIAMSPSLMRLANEETREDEHAQQLGEHILAALEDFSLKSYKFQLGNKLRVVLMRGDGEMGRLRERMTRGGSAALEACREFAANYRDRAQILRLLGDAELRSNNYKMTGIDGIARERMLGLIQNIAAQCAEYVETVEAAPTMRRTLATLRRLQGAIADTVTALDGALERFEVQTPLEAGALGYARHALALFAETVQGRGRLPAPTEHMMALHGPLLWFSTLDFGLGWLPAPYAPEILVDAILGLDALSPDGPVDADAFVKLVENRIEAGSHIGASMLIDMAEFLSIPDALADTLTLGRQVDIASRRDALTAVLRDARLAVDRVQRMRGAGSQDDAQSLLSLLDRIAPEELPNVVPIESRGEVPEPEQILDFKAAYGLIADVRARVDLLLKQPRDELMVRIRDMAHSGSAVEADLEKVRGLVERDDLLTAMEYLEFLKDGRALPETTSPNPRFLAYFPDVPKRLAAMPREDQDAILQAVDHGGEFAGLNFGRIPGDRRSDVKDALEAWGELRRAVVALRAESDVTGKLVRMLERFGLKVDILSTQSRNNRRIYNADLRIDLPMDRTSVLLPDFGSQTGGSYRVCIATKMPSDSEIRGIQNDAGALRVIFFVTETVSPERRHQLHLSCLENQTRLLIIDESMVFFALAEPELRGVTLVELAQPFSFADPYKDYGNGAVPREMFFGRSAEGRKLKDPHGSCIVYGGRRLGKTALLRHIQTETNDPAAGVAVAYVSVRDLGGKAGENQIWEYMSGELKAIFPKPVEQSDRFSEAVRAWLGGDSKRRILVLLDESDRFIEADASEAFTQFIRLQKLMDETNRRFKFVLAGLHNVTRLVHTENPPLKQIASDPQRIGPLMDEELGDAEALVTRPMAGMGYEFQNREDVWRILSYCNYYPVLVQKFCKELLQELVAETKKKRRAIDKITSEHIRAALENEHIAKEIGETFDTTIKIEDRYSLIAHIVADRALRDAQNGRIGEGMSAVEVRDAAASWWPKAFNEANRLAVVEDLLDEMEGLGVLRCVQGNRWALRSPTILRLLGDDDKIAAKLGEFMDRPAPPVFDPRSMRRQLKASSTMRVVEGATCPLTLGQEHDLLRDRAPVTLIFGNAASDIGMVTGALASMGEGSDQRRVAEVSARSFPDAEAMTKDLKGAAAGLPAMLHVVSDLSRWNPQWVERALRAKAVREGRARVIFVGRPEHALEWVRSPLNPMLAAEVKILPLQTWSATLTDEMLQRDHLDVDALRGPLRDATGGYNQLMHDVFSAGASTNKAFSTRLQAIQRRHRDVSLPLDLGLLGQMAEVFQAIVRFAGGEIVTAYEIGEGPVLQLDLDLSGQRVVDFGLLMGLLEPLPASRDETEDARPFRVNPLLVRLFGAGSGRD
ncbi:hypothetical protein ASE85_07675 [Sphingobium sp. Leaf26]|nr:hypothetical protein ASE85_07675 [Sphingobium sp. Leaf26]